MPSKPSVPRVCLGCGKDFLAVIHEVRRGNGQYCCKQCWSDTFNKPRVKVEGTPRRKRPPKAVKKYQNSQKYPFLWMDVKKRKGGQPKSFYARRYGTLTITALKLPKKIKALLEKMAKARKKSVSRIVLEFVEGGILRTSFATELRSNRVVKPRNVGGERFGWREEEIRKLDEMCNGDRDHLESEEQETSEELPCDDETPDDHIPNKSDREVP